MPFDDYLIGEGFNEDGLGALCPDGRRVLGLVLSMGQAAAAVGDAKRAAEYARLAVWCLRPPDESVLPPVAVRV